MKYPCLYRFALVATCVGAAFPVVAKDLDAALAAQKKKATRRVYSESALIESRNLLIPTLPTNEEMALDLELEQLEKRLDSQAARSQTPMMQQHAPRIVPVQQKNWLTPTMLDPHKDDELSAKKRAPDWAEVEMTRQGELQQQTKRQEDEKALVEKLLKEKSQKARSFQNIQLDPYASSLHNTSSKSYQPLQPHTLANPLDSMHQKKPTATSNIDPFFSPNIPHPTKGIKPAPRLGQATSWTPDFNKPASSSSGKESPFEITKPKPLSPIKKIRQSSPIHRKDPFAEDLMPEIKTSIWD